MMVCFETGRTPLGRKGRNRISSVRRVPVYPCATISSYNLATLWHPWFHREERRGKVRINDGRRARSSSPRWRRFLFESTIDTARTDSDETSQSALCDILLDTVSRSAYEDSLVGDDEHGALVRLFPAPLPSQQEEYLHPDNLPVRTATTWTLGYAYQLQGDRAAASQAYTEIIATATGLNATGFRL